MTLQRNRPAAGAAVPPPAIVASAAFARENGQHLLGPASSPPTGRTRATASTWLRPVEAVAGVPFGFNQNPGTAYSYLQFGGGAAEGQLQFVEGQTAGPISANYRTQARFRDPTAWYHVHLAIDTAQPVAADRVQFWINGARLAVDVLTAVPQGSSLIWNENGQFRVGFNAESAYLNGLQAMTVLLRDERRPYTDFAEFNGAGVWIPKAIEFTPIEATSAILDYADGADLGKDVSGNGNHFSNVNGVTQRVDSPDDTYPILHHLDYISSANTINDAGLLSLHTGSGYLGIVRSTTVLPVSGQWCARFVANVSNSAQPHFGLHRARSDFTGGRSSLYSRFAVQGDGQVLRLGVPVGNLPGGGILTSDVMALVVDMDASPRTAQVYRNGATDGPAWDIDQAVGLERVVFSVGGFSSSTFRALFGENGDPPIPGSKWPSSRAMPTPEIVDSRDYAENRHRAGNDTLNPVALQAGFDEGITFCKQHNGTNWWQALDSRRGEGPGGRGLSLNLNDVGQEYEIPAGSKYVIGAPGRDIDGPYSSTNALGNIYIDQHFRPDPACGISVVTYTGDGVAGRAVPHGLTPKIPRMVWVKIRGPGGSPGHWAVGHDYLGMPSLGASWSYWMNLNTADARFSGGAGSWNNSPPDVGSVYLSGATDVNGAGLEYVMYCFAEVPGFSAFGFHDGNGSADGPFDMFDFTPAWWFVKSATATQGWPVMNLISNPTNPIDKFLQFDIAQAEQSIGEVMDRCAAGLKHRSGSALFNGLSSFIYGAFARYPCAGVAPRAI